MYCATVYNRAMQIKLSNQGFILVLLPLAMQISFVIIFLGMLEQAEEDIATERKSRQIVGSMSRITRLLLAALSGDSLMMAPPTGYGKAAPKHAAYGIPAEFERLRQLASDRPEQLKVIEKLENTWKGNLESTRELKQLANEGSPLEALRQYAKIKRNITRIRVAIEDAAQYFREFDEKSPKLLAESRERQKNALIVFFVANAIMAVCLCIYFNSRTRSRLNLLMSNAKSLASEKPVESIRPLEGNDEISELQRTMVTIAQSLTSVRRKEKAILDNAADVICSIDSSQCIRSASPATRKLWGYAEEDLIGRKLPELIEPVDWSETQKKFVEIKQSGGNKDAEVENRIRTASGASMYMVWNIHWSREEQSYFCVVHDISALRRLEKLKRDFTSMITHDIRSPISSVLAFLSLVEENVYGELNEKGLAKLKETEESIGLVIQLISDLLDLEKNAAGMLTLDVTETTSMILMEQAHETIKPVADAKEIKIILAGDDVALSVDEARVVKVFVSLLTNSVKYSEPGASIAFQCTQQLDGVTFTISDEGLGFSPESLVSVFDLYSQLRQEDATVRGGTGLGLAIAKSIVEKHRGAIRAECDGERGSRFVVDLPAV